MYPPNRYPCLEQILCLSNIYIHISSIQTLPLPPFNFVHARVRIKFFSKIRSQWKKPHETRAIPPKLFKPFEPFHREERIAEDREPTTMDVLTRLDGIAMATSILPSRSWPPFRSKENRRSDSRSLLSSRVRVPSFPRSRHDRSC